MRCAKNILGNLMASTASTQVIQSELLCLLKIFDSFCMQHSINYSLHGGSLLGAVRNKGFIEWDDDADVSMTRKNFDKFLEAIKSSSPNFHCDLNTSQRPMIWSSDPSSFVWIDVFVYDFISENRLFQRCKLGTSIFFLALTKTPKTMKIFRSGVHRKGWKRVSVEIIYLLGRLFPQKVKLALWRFLSINFFNGSKQLIFRTNDQYIGLKKILPSRTMEKYTRLPFEDTCLQVTRDWHEILLSCYGHDYMAPKREKDLVVDAHNTYRKFKK